MARARYTPEELVDAEIERLKNRKRKYLADLRWLEKRGKALMAEGWTQDTLELLFKDIPDGAGD